MVTDLEFIQANAIETEQKAEKIAFVIAKAIRSEFGVEGDAIVQSAILGLTKGLAIASENL